MVLTTTMFPVHVMHFGEDEFQKFIVIGQRGYDDPRGKIVAVIYLNGHMAMSLLCSVLLSPTDEAFPVSDYLDNIEAIRLIKTALAHKYSQYAYENRDLAMAKLEELLEMEATLRAQKKLASLVARHWYDAQSNPHNPLGRKRLMKMFAAMADHDHA